MSTLKFGNFLTLWGDSLRWAPSVSLNSVVLIRSRSDCDVYLVHFTLFLLAPGGKGDAIGRGSLTSRCGCQEEFHSFHSFSGGLFCWSCFSVSPTDKNSQQQEDRSTTRRISLPFSCALNGTLAIEKLCSEKKGGKKKEVSASWQAQTLISRLWKTAELWATITSTQKNVHGRVGPCTQCDPPSPICLQLAVHEVNCVSAGTSAVGQRFFHCQNIPVEWVESKRIN